jgi:hypothetical protein
MARRLFAHFVGDEKTIYYNLFGKWDRELQKHYVANHTVRLLRVPDLAERRSSATNEDYRQRSPHNSPEIWASGHWSSNLPMAG